MRFCIAGISCGLPQRVERNADCELFQTPAERERFMSSTGVEERHIARLDTCTSDLAVPAVEQLIDKLGWERSSIRAIIVVTQTPDYLGPCTSVLLQDRLKLPKSCLAFDIPLGCSGYVYGLAVTGSMMNSIGLDRCLLIAGDTLSRQASKEDKTAYPLFGDACTASALERSDSDADAWHFDFGTDGSGWQAIMIPEGGYRSPVSHESLVLRNLAEGVKRTGLNTVMQGMDVFSFAISVAPESIRAALLTAGVVLDEVDYLVMHQANRFLNESIRKKLGLPQQKVPYSLKDYGNTSSGSIPLTIASQLREQVKSDRKKVVLCGFGVGLSWGTAVGNLGPTMCPENVYF